MKIPHRVRQDFNFLLNDPLDMIGQTIMPATSTPAEGCTALEAWFMLDTHGKTVPCREPEQLDKVKRTKASWNLQIKMYAESIVECTLTHAELATMLEGKPAWIHKAVTQQARKLALKQHGWIPAFVDSISQEPTLKIQDNWLAAMEASAPLK